MKAKPNPCSCVVIISHRIKSIAPANEMMWRSVTTRWLRINATRRVGRTQTTAARQSTSWPTITNLSLHPHTHTYWLHQWNDTTLCLKKRHWCSTL